MLGDYFEVDVRQLWGSMPRSMLNRANWCSRNFAGDRSEAETIITGTHDEVAVMFTTVN